MAALSADKNIVRFGAQMADSPNAVPVKAATTLYAGSGIVLGTDGYAVAATAAANLITVGVARIGVANTGADGAIKMEVDHGDFLFDNSGSDAITVTEVGKLCYWEDDHTVCKTATGKSAVGRVIQLNPEGFTGVVVRVATGMNV
jgi:hypothetical protein